MEKQTIKNESFRDSIATIDQDGNREYVFPKKPHGKLHNYRLMVSGVLLLVFFGTPFIRMNGEPFFLFDVINRKFIFFGQLFWPQDTYIFAVMMLTLIVFIVVFTVSFGRLWCGWACPQTLFLEMVFRKIEYWIDGDARDQRRLAKEAILTFEKIWKRIVKYSIFLAIAFIIALTLFSWVIGTDQLFIMMQEPVSENRAAFIAFLALSGFLMFVYSWFREQVCVLLCPYGRLQSVLLDRNSIVVAYDYIRGEPRANFRKGEDRKGSEKGDCIDCHACVQVCPTAIDIRNGTQLECINCTACIDACNQTMTRVGMPKGLVRFDSERGISTGKKLRLNARLIAYISVLVVLFVFLNMLLFNRTDVETTILRTPGLLFQEQDNDRITNLYNIKVVNKKREEFPIRIQLLSHDGKIVMAAGPMKVKAASSTEGVFFVFLDKADVKGKIPIQLGVYTGDKLIEKIDLTFVGPNQ
nr:cytochrome c oxidase accessory protein CcoG [Bacteroidota bacterium]